MRLITRYGRMEMRQSCIPGVGLKLMFHSMTAKSGDGVSGYGEVQITSDTTNCFFLFSFFLFLSLLFSLTFFLFFRFCCYCCYCICSFCFSSIS